jgi:acetyl-CoA carboxylase carboxyltransferase component
MDNVGKRDLFLEKKAAVSKASPARDRIALILDEGSFMEVGAFVKQRPTELGGIADAAAEGVVTGWGTVNGAPVCVFSQDAAALGGAVSEMHAKKICALYDYALKTGIPVVGVFDSKGARIAEGVDALNGYAAVIAKATAAASLVPQIAVIAGNCGGAAAVAASCFDFTVAVEGSEFYFNSPTVIAARSGAAEVKAGAAEAVAAGKADFAAKTDAEAAGIVRALISYLPANSSGDKNYAADSDDINRLTDLEALGAGDAASVLAAAADNGEYLEIGAGYADEVFTGLARFDGEAVAVVGFFGTVTAAGAAKAADFIGFADMFGLSVVTVLNSGGFDCSAEFESCGLTAAASLAGAYASASVPTVTLITGLATGSAYVAMGAKGLGCDMVFAWPQAEISALNAGAAVDLLCADALKAADDPIAERAKLTAEYGEKLASPYEAARHGYVDEIVDLLETRQALVYALGLLSTKN